MAIVTHIVLGVLIGFIGFLPIGMINLNVADAAIKKGIGSGLAIALGASLVGVLQAMVSLYFAGEIMSRPEIEVYLNWLSVPVLVSAGLFFLYGPKPRGVTDEAPRMRNLGLLKGVLLSTMNVVAIPFWIFYSSYLSSMHLIDLTSFTLLLLFSIGGGSGMMLVFYIYAQLGRYAKDKLAVLTKYSSSAIAAVMFLLAAIQVLRLIL